MVELAPLLVHDRGKGKKVFYEYLMTGDKMFQIVKEKHKENAAKEARAQKKEQCVKTALSKLRQEQRSSD